MHQPIQSSRNVRLEAILVLSNSGISQHRGTLGSGERDTGIIRGLWEGALDRKTVFRDVLWGPLHYGNLNAVCPLGAHAKAP